MRLRRDFWYLSGTFREYIIILFAQGWGCVCSYERLSHGSAVGSWSHEGSFQVSLLLISDNPLHLLSFSPSPLYSLYGSYKFSNCSSVFTAHLYVSSSDWKESFWGRNISLNNCWSLYISVFFQKASFFCRSYLFISILQYPYFCTFHFNLIKNVNLAFRITIWQVVY